MRLFLVAIGLCIVQISFAQQHTISLSQLVSVVDTLSIENNLANVRLTWMQDTIEIRSRTASFEYDIEAMRRIRRDSAYVASIEDKQQMVSFMETASQNCYSYALQRHLAYNDIAPQMLFNERTVLTRESLETIINGSFTLIGGFSSQETKRFKENPPEGTLIAFRNKMEWIIHTFYFENGIYYSKNGAWPIKEYKRMKDVYKRYWDTLTVEFYHLNRDSIDAFINGSK